MKKKIYPHSILANLCLITMSFLLLERCTDETPPPEIESIAPLKGYIGDPVTLTGKSLGSPTKIMFDNVNSEYAFGAGNTITILVPPDAKIGNNSISVTTAGGASNSINFEVMEDLRPADPLPPVLEKLYPSKNFINYPLLIYGNNLSKAKVTFNNIPAVIYTSNQNVVTTIVPEGLPSGNVQLKITTPKGNSNTLNFNVTGPPPPGVPIINFSIVSVPPPNFVPTISNNWDCGLFSDNGDGTFVDLFSDDGNGNFNITGKYEYGYDKQNKYNFLNYVEVTDSETNETLAGQFSSKFDNPCILEMVLISSETGKILTCTFNRKIADGEENCDD